MSIGERIKKARELRGMSLEELAIQVGFVTYSLESEAYDPSLMQIVKLCDALNVTADWLLGRIPDDRILLPRELTAENGAKAALIGEFFEEYEVECCECEGEGVWEDEKDCECCNGTGRLPEKVPVEWTTTKEIYKAIVAHFEKRNNYG